MAGRMVARGLRGDLGASGQVLGKTRDDPSYAHAALTSPFKPGAAFESEQPLPNGLTRDGPIA